VRCRCARCRWCATGRPSRCSRARRVLCRRAEAPVGRRSGGLERTGRAGVERLDGLRALVRRTARCGADEADRHLEAALLHVRQLDALPVGAELDTPALGDRDGHVLDALGARHEVLPVPEAEGTVAAHEVGGRHLGTQEIAGATRWADLAEDVLLQGVHARQARAREQGFQEELADRAARLDAALLQAHLEFRHPGAAGRVLEVGETVPVVVDAVPADFLRRRGAFTVVTPRAVVEAADEGTARAAAGECPAGAAATRDVAVAGLAGIDDAVATKARVGKDGAATRALVDAPKVLALDRLQILADDRVTESPARDRRGPDTAADLRPRTVAPGVAREVRPARVDGGTGEAPRGIALLSRLALSVAADGRGGDGGRRGAGGVARAGGRGGDRRGARRPTLAVVGARAVVEAADEGAARAAVAGERPAGAAAARDVAVTDLLALD